MSECDNFIRRMQSSCKPNDDTTWVILELIERVDRIENSNVEVLKKELSYQIDKVISLKEQIARLEGILYGYREILGVKDE